MATSLRSSFVSGTSMSSFSKIAEPRIRSTRVHFRIVSESSSPATVRGSEGNTAKRPDGEVSSQTMSFIGNGIEKQGDLWWAPIFNVSAEEQWSNLLPEEAKEHEMERSASSSPPVAPGNATAIVALTDLTDSQTNDQTRQKSSRPKVNFTADKARALRKSMRASETWHDGWYHSAIASRLAESMD